METLKVTIVNVVVKENANAPYVWLNLTKPIKAYTVQRNADGTTARVLADTTALSMNLYQLSNELSAANELIDEYVACRATLLDQKALNIILRGAELTLERIAHKAGDAVNGEDGQPLVDAFGKAIVFANDCHTTHITAVKLTDRATTKLDDALSL